MRRTAKRREFQKKKGGEKEKEASELARSPGSSKSESCVSPSASHKENPAWVIPLAAQSGDGVLSRGTIPIPFSGVFSLGLLSKKVCPSKKGLVVHRTEAYTWRVA
ncbi:uncharacterized protein LOC128145602 isoform X8 [Harpia harpyja]|uniref:uncharacterized protein LOC128145602 isoform X8 n=1 Tax=Harpia harpyja TaxID=202280 RepID=UPI0022B21585|nr:uncharacterized protein LOC128145602 isoform X8 [Harpia harpyja]